MSKIKKGLLKGSILKATAIASVMLGAGTELSAANWLTLQGTQPAVVAPKGVVVPYRRKTPKLWGFIQVNYKSDSGDILVPGAGGNKGKNLTPFSMLNPDLSDQSGFNVFRARLALRGMADKDNNVNYFFMTEFGNSGVNNLVGHRDIATYFTDASVTLKHVPYAKLRVGMFKTPGAEEGLQAVFVSPYIEFTAMTNQQLLERQIKNTGLAQTGGKAGGASTVHYTSTKVEDPVSAFRDTGAQVFDTVDVANNWSVSYAYMYGNGNGISMKSSNQQETHYGYLALTDSFNKGRGYYTEEMKFFVWGQDGDRSFISQDPTTLVKSEVTAKRKRYGLGMTYYKDGLRFEAEYSKAEGMIYTGAKDIDVDPLTQDWQFQYAIGDENEADGGYVNLQYEIAPKKFEMFARYDVLNRLTNDTKGERQFKTVTVGCSYRFKGPTRIDFNYIMKDADAPGNANAQKVLDNMGNRFALQLTAAF